MKLIVGLGNPGDEYLHTRHNVGFMFIDYLAEHLNASVFSFHKKSQADIVEAHVKEQKILLAKPQTYMNESGLAVRALSNFYKVSPEDLLIVHDDLDIQIGEYKIQKGKGPKVHNGILSIEEHLGTGDFMRLRIGIDARIPDLRTPGRGYVLQAFSVPEREKIEQEVFAEAQVSLFSSWIDQKSV